MIKKFKCGMCKKLNKEVIAMTRKNLRKHLRDKHGFKQELTNVDSTDKIKVKQSWWIVEDFS